MASFSRSFRIALGAFVLWGALHLARADELEDVNRLFRAVASALDSEDLATARTAAESAHAARLSDGYKGLLLNNVGMRFMNDGHFDDAETYLKEGLKCRQRLGDRALAAEFGSLVSLGELYKRKELYARAILEWKKCDQVLARDTTGKIDRVLQAYRHNNLGKLYEITGQYGSASDAYAECLKLLTGVGNDQDLGAYCRNNRGWLSYAIGKEELRKQHEAQRRSEEEKEQGNGAAADEEMRRARTHAAAVATRFRAARGDFETAVRLCTARLERLGGQPATDNNVARVSYYLADSCNCLAVLCMVEKKYDEAEGHFEQGFRYSRELPKGWKNEVTARLKHHQAALLRARQDYKKAMALHLESHELFKKITSTEHANVANSLAHQAWVLACEGNWLEAAKRIGQNRRQLNRHAHAVLSSQSEPEQLLFLNNKDRPWLHAALTMGWRGGKDREVAERSAEWALNGKGLTIQVLAERTVLRRQASSDPVANQIYQKLLGVRNELSVRTLQPNETGLAQLIKEEEDLSRQLGQQLGSLAAASGSWIELGAVRARLPKKSVLIEVVRFDAAEFDKALGVDLEWSGPRYVAWVIPPRGEGQVEVVDLGSAGLIDAAVQRVREQIEPHVKDGEVIQPKRGPEGERKAHEVLGPLTDRVLKPLYPHIKDRERWIIGPDAELWRVPWAALLLPGAKRPYAIENHMIGYVTSGRDLLTRRGGGGNATAPLVFAFPSFGDLPNDDRELAFTRLKIDESKIFEEGLQQWTRQRPRMLTETLAKEAEFHEATSPRALVFSTHGFFRSPQSGNESENPLLRCGLAMAEANRRGSGTRDPKSDGILFGMEVLDKDLRATELVFLSACQTAVGKVRPGEGVANLQHAFRLAGAQAVVGTLWEVPQEPTALLAEKFFAHAEVGKDNAQSLQSAQIELIRSLRRNFQAAQPYSWAAFTLVGNAP